MDNARTAGRNEFIDSLMRDVSPEELPLISDYQSAIDAPSVKNIDGLEFGIEDAVVALGPLIVFAGTKVFTDLSQWTLQTGEKIAEKYIKKGTEHLLSRWLSSPKKGGLREVLNEDGKRELMSMVRASFRNKKIPKENVDKVLAALERRLFDDR